MFVSSFKKGQWYGFFLMTQKFEVKNLEYYYKWQFDVKHACRHRQFFSSFRLIIICWTPIKFVEVHIKNDKINNQAVVKKNNNKLYWYRPIVPKVT